MISSVMLPLRAEPAVQADSEDLISAEQISAISSEIFSEICSAAGAPAGDAAVVQ